jgi:hypothetical protein
MKRALYLAAIIALLGAAAAWPATQTAVSAPGAPLGTTAIALDGQVGIAWQPVEGATSYEVLRATTVAGPGTPISPGGLSDTRFVDTTAVNGTTYFYRVLAIGPAGSSDPSAPAQARPRGRSCSTGNEVVQENCFPGTTAWKTLDATPSGQDGIEGFASASSIEAGESVDLRLESAPDVPYRIEIYRTGSYGGDQGRLVSVIPNLTGRYQLGCFREPSTTGIVDCSEWEAGATVTTTPDWPSGVYLLKLIREDNGAENEILLVVRDDDSTSDVAFMVPTTTYQAYNNHYGKSLYSGASDSPNTVSGTPRAVMVSFDRPYTQPSTPSGYRRDWYTRTDVATVSWLEQQGYDVTYLANEDLHANGALAQQHAVLISGAHDEYWSQQMFDAAKAARDAGTSIFFTGANSVYWKVRLVPGALTGVPNRLMVAYKTIESGPVDPSGISTSTWRDPAGANRPENELQGQMYIGENIGHFFPLRVSAAEGKHRLWRYTSLPDLPAGESAAIGTGLVGWEWNARADNGREPPGVETVASSPVFGRLIQNNGAFLTDGNATAAATIYRDDSGAVVFATGTNNWWRGLARNAEGEGEPDARIQQATMNAMSDMGAQPTTPSAGLVKDAVGAPAVQSTSPASGAGGIAPNLPVTATFDRPLDPSSLGPNSFTLRDSGGALVPASVTFDAASRTATLRPDETLEPFVTYTARIEAGIKSWHGEATASPHTWTFTTGPGTPPVVTTRSPASGATGVATDAVVTARFDRRLDPSSVSAATVRLREPGGDLVPAQVTYDDPTRTVRLDPNASLSEAATYTVELTTGLRANDDTPMAAPTSWSFTTGLNLQVTSRTPTPLASGISPAAVVRAVFSRAVNPATLTASSFTLTAPGGGQVAAQVSYDPTTRTATLRPDAPLTLLSTYTASVTGAVHADDGGALAPSTWTFTTAATPPPAPAVTAATPGSGSQGVTPGARIRATFDLPLDVATVTTQNFTLTPAGGSPVAATVTYDAAASRATLTPVAPLTNGTHYTATVSTGVRAATGAPLAASVSWSFDTANCPCSLMPNLQPDMTGVAVRDNRPLPGPWSYELGTRIRVTAESELIALRFWKDPGETGTHVGRVWSSSGTQLASATFQNESASGWQRQLLASPVTLQPGQTYVVSVGLNAFYVKTMGGLGTQRTSGTLQSVADGSNGVFASAAGQFPTDSWGSSNYFVDAVVKLPGEPARTPQVSSTLPLANATGVAPGATVRATFAVDIDPATLNSSTFTLRDDADNLVPATVSYDEDTRVASLTPNDPLDAGTSYLARLATTIRSDDGTAMGSPYAWSFATVPPGPPQVIATSPVSGGVDVSQVGGVTATFSEPMNAATLQSGGLILNGPSGAVPATITYDNPTRTATLTPSSPLAASTAYTAQVTTAAQSAKGIAIAAPVSWGFTTSACPCRLYGAGNPGIDFTGISTRNGRDPAFQWSLELGVKVRVDQPARLDAIRFWKDADETGTHTGRVWTAGGTLLGTASFTGESASGWQEATLSTPVNLVAGQTYVVSVGINAYFSQTRYALSSAIVSGPLRTVADGQNGVYGDAAGAFPSQSYASSSYFVDPVIR